MGSTLYPRSYKRILNIGKRSILSQPKNCSADMGVFPLRRRSSALEKSCKVGLREKNLGDNLKKLETGQRRKPLSADY